jgi:hypothetical protein
MMLTGRDFGPISEVSMDDAVVRRGER